MDYIEHVPGGGDKKVNVKIHYTVIKIVKIIIDLDSIVFIP